MSLSISADFLSEILPRGIKIEIWENDRFPKNIFGRDIEYWQDLVQRIPCNKCVIKQGYEMDEQLRRMRLIIKVP